MTSSAAGNAGAAGTDFYNFLASAMNAAASGLGGSGGNAQENAPSGAFTSSASPDLGRGVGAFPAGDMTASGTLVPPSIRDDAAKMTFLATQREKLNLVLSALDREAAALRSGATSPGSPVPQAISLDQPHEESGRPTTSASAKSGLSKSRSEADFEKIEAESGAEDNAPEGLETARPTPGPRSGSWMPWGWGASGEKSKEE